MQSFNKILIALIAIILSSCTTTERHVSGFNYKTVSHKKVVIFPSEVTIYVRGVSTNERQENHEYYVEDILNDEARKAFEKKGFSVKFASKRLMHDSGISRSFSILRDEFIVHKKEMYKTIPMDTKAAGNLGIKHLPALEKFKESFPADYYIMLDYEGYIKSDGSRTMDFAVAAFVPGARVDPAEKYVLIVTFIESGSGNVIWANAGMQERSHFAGLTDNLYKKETIERSIIQSLLTQALAKF